MKSLILDAKENHALAATRSLSRYGFRVTCADETSLSKSFYSRSCKERFVYPSPRTDVDAFLDCLLFQLAKEPYEILFPMTEKTIWPISIARDRFPNRVILPIAEHDVLLKAFDKRETIKTAKELGIAVPETYFPKDLEEIRTLSRHMDYPIVIKPPQSENLVDGKMIAGGRPQYANSPAALLELCKQYDHRLPPPLLQEFVPGTGHGIFTLFHKGEPLVWFAHRRLRDVRPTGSGSSLRESVVPDPEIRRPSETILRHINWDGVAMVEFRRDSRSGAYKLMEINGRFWNSLPLCIASGVDFPLLLYKAFANLELPTEVPYKKNVRCRWLLGDVRHFFEVMRGKPANFKGVFPRRLPTFRAMLLDTLDGGMHYDVWAVNDPLPFFVEIAEMVIRAFKK